MIVYLEDKELDIKYCTVSNYNTITLTTVDDRDIILEIKYEKIEKLEEYLLENLNDYCCIADIVEIVKINDLCDTLKLVLEG